MTKSHTSEFMKKYLCEFLGTLVLVLLGCGSAAIISASIGALGLVGIAFAFGLSIVAMAYSIGRISGCHVNPAVSLAMLISGKMSGKDFICYVVAQVLGAFAGAGLLLLIINNTTLGDIGLGANGYGELSQAGLGMWGAILVEIIATFIFIVAILGVTDDSKYDNVSGLVIGLTLALIHIVCIPLTGTSVNPARSLAPAVLVGGEALSQVWVFIVAPFVGAALAAYCWKFLRKN
ncbi:MAG: MIP family channel protein [Clostridia bacterium]|nr:MIP family channel protein [Clostridia bacterium]